jgi:hypothetical protein
MFYSVCSACTHDDMTSSYVIMNVCAYMLVNLCAYILMNVCAYIPMNVCAYMLVNVCAYIVMNVCAYMLVNVCVVCMHTREGMDAKRTTFAAHLQEQCLQHA